MCLTVLIQHDSTRSAWIFECCRTGWHRFLSIFQRLSSNHHLYLLIDFITHSSCRQGRNHCPFDKEQTLFLEQLCLAVFRVEACQERTVHQCLHEDHYSTPAERDKREKRTGLFEPHTHERALGLSVPSESWTLTRRPVTCWRRARLAVWIPIRFYFDLDVI